VLEDRAQFGPRFIIPEPDREAPSRRVNFVDRNVDVHIVRVVMDDAHPLMFSVAELFAKRSSITRRVLASGFSPVLSETSR